MTSHESRRTAGRLAADIAETYLLPVHDVLRGATPHARWARNDLVARLTALGWTASEIESNFGWPRGTATVRPSGEYEVARVPTPVAETVTVAEPLAEPEPPVRRISRSIAPDPSARCQAPRGASLTKTCGKVIVDAGRRLCRWHASAVLTAAGLPTQSDRDAARAEIERER